MSGISLVNHYEDQWKFIFPIEVDHFHEEFWEGVEYLDYKDHLAEKAFKKIISRLPEYHIDAYNHLSLAFRNQGKTLESKLTAERAYILGKRCFPKTFKRKKHTLPWRILENRAFLRACHILGLEYQHEKKYDVAIKFYEEILQLNPGDHQGVRDLIVDCLFMQGNFSKANKIFKRYPKDETVEHHYGKFIVSFKEENYKKSKAHLIRARKAFPKVAEEIIKDEHVEPKPYRNPELPIHISNGVPMGSVQEAYWYWYHHQYIFCEKTIVEFVKEN